MTFLPRGRWEDQPDPMSHCFLLWKHFHLTWDKAQCNVLGTKIESDQKIKAQEEAINWTYETKEAMEWTKLRVSLLREIGRFKLVSVDNGFDKGGVAFGTAISMSTSSCQQEYTCTIGGLGINSDNGGELVIEYLRNSSSIMELFWGTDKEFLTKGLSSKKNNILCYISTQDMRITFVTLFSMVVSYKLKYLRRNREYRCGGTLDRVWSLSLKNWGSQERS